LSDFALNHEHLPPIMSIGVNMPGQTAPYLASFLEELSIAFFVAESA